MFRDHSARVLTFLGHRGAGDAAPDLLSEVFTTTWRRIDDVPDPALPWLLGVARNTLAHHWRAQGQQAALALQAAHAANREHPSHRGGPATLDIADVVAERSAVITALAALADEDREVLLLIGWDGLTAGEAAAVLGCAPGAFAVRLHRARRRLQRVLDPPPWSDPAVTTALPASARPGPTTRTATSAAHRQVSDLTTHIPVPASVLKES
nr:sigma-70 family RNA polymerase sigma factor [Quadrisphaera sp. RL12-1S]